MHDSDIPDLGPRKKFVRSLVEKLIKTARIVEVPVSLQKVIEYLQSTRDLKVWKINVGEKISGLLVVCKKVDSEYATIGFNGNHPWCRRRFTIAHEIGHLLMNHACSSSENDGAHNEREADLFAAELLMPKSLLKKDFQNGITLPELAKFYRVSQEALTRRLIEARLL